MTSLKVLIGPLYEPRIIGKYQHSPAVKTVIDASKADDISSQYDIHYQLNSLCHFEDILEQLPPNWIPDAVIWIGFAYHGLPPGIETCPYPTLLVPGDWDKCFLNCVNFASAFDWVLGGKRLLDKLHERGIHSTFKWSFFSFDPQEYYCVDQTERIYDIGFIGNLNHQLHQKRYSYLKRLTALSSKYRIFMGGNIYGEAYRQLLNQSKIVFNHSISGEMNMRAYEAPACGALLFMEEDNQDIGDFLKDGYECVLYNAHNFEELLDYYLTHDEERLAIARRGREKIQAFSYERQFETLLAHLPELIARTDSSQRQFNNLPAQKQRYFRTSQLYQAVSPGSKTTALTHLMKNEEEVTDIALLNAMGTMLYSNYVYAEKHKPESIGSIQTALKLFRAGLYGQSFNPILLYHQALCLEWLEQPIEALLSYQSCLNQLSVHFVTLDQLRDFVLPFGYTAFSIGWQLSSFEFLNETESRLKAYLRLIRYQCYLNMGKLYCSQEEYPLAIEHLLQAADLLPDNHEAMYAVASLYRQLGQVEQAITAYQQTLERQLFLPQVWFEFLEFLIEQRYFQMAQDYLARVLQIWQVEPLNKTILEQLAAYQLVINFGLNLFSPLLNTFIPSTYPELAYPKLALLTQALPASGWIKDLFSPLTVAWNTFLPEKMPELPQVTGFILQSGEAAQMTVGSASPVLPQCYQRVYTAQSDLAQGLLGLDLLPPLFLEPSQEEDLGLAGLNQLNFLFLCTQYQTEKLLQLSQYLLGYPEVTLWIWNPLSLPTEEELEWLNDSLPPESNTTLLTEPLRGQEQAALLQQFDLILSAGDEPTVSFYSWWGLYLQTPVVTFQPLRSPYACISQLQLDALCLNDFKDLFEQESLKQRVSVINSQLQEFYQISYQPQLLQTLWSLKQNLYKSKAGESP